MNTELVQCPTAGCGHSPFPMSTDFIRRARQTHEDFHCPAGHLLHFGGKSDADRLAALEADLERSRKTVRYLHGRIRALHDYPVCSWPGCGRRCREGGPMAQHMQRAHGAPTLAELELLEAEAS